MAAMCEHTPVLRGTLEHTGKVQLHVPRGGVLQSASAVHVRTQVPPDESHTWPWGVVSHNTRLGAAAHVKPAPQLMLRTLVVPLSLWIVTRPHGAQSHPGPTPQPLASTDPSKGSRGGRTVPPVPPLVVVMGAPPADIPAAPPAPPGAPPTTSPPWPPAATDIAPAISPPFLPPDTPPWASMAGVVPEAQAPSNNTATNLIAAAPSWQTPAPA